GVAVFIPRTGKDGGSGMEHDGDAVCFRGAIDNFQFLDPAQIVVRKQQLMRRMNFDHTDSEAEQLLYVGKNVRCVARMKAGARNQARGVFFRVIGHELIHFGSEPDHFGSYIIDENSPFDTRSIKMLQKNFRRTAKLRDLIEILPLPFHQFQRVRLKEFEWLDVDVAIGDQSSSIWRPRAEPCVLKNPQTT